MPKRILIVDDNEHIRKSARSFLESHPDFEICGEAVDGREAIEKAKQLQPDLIVLDLSMPVMDGMEAAREIRKAMPKVPIILFTLYDDGEVTAETAGVSAVVAKTDMHGLMRHAQTLLKSEPSSRGNSASQP